MQINTQRENKTMEYNTLLRYGLDLRTTKLSCGFRIFSSFFPAQFHSYPLVVVCPAECNILAKFLFSPSVANIYPQSNKDIYLSTNFHFPCWKCLCSLLRAEQQLLTTTESAEARTERWRQWAFCCLPAVLSLRVNLQIFHPLSLLRQLSKALSKID